MLAFDRANCGACGNACKPGRDCCGGRCVDVSGGDEQNCGCCGCGCLPGQEVCAGGQCKAVCAAGKTRCGKKCVNLQTNRKHCGECRRRCGRGQACTDGQCLG